MRLFIDTNVYLGFLRSSDESPDSLNELETLIDNKEISLIFPKITEEELIRNVPNVEAAYIKEIEQNLPKAPNLSTSLKRKDFGNNFKKICGDYKKELEKLEKSYLSSVEKIESKILLDIKSKAIGKLNDAGLVQKAYQRKLLGNPPGKKGHIGDELEWEILINCFFDEDLTIVTDDRDWKDVIKVDQLNPLLKREWKKVSNKKLMLYATLGEFINAHMGRDKITKEDIKNEKMETSTVGLIVQNAPVGSVVFDPAYSMSLPIVPSTNISNVSTPLLLDSRYLSVGGTIVDPGLRYCQFCGERIDSNVIHFCKK